MLEDIHNSESFYAALTIVRLRFLIRNDLRNYLSRTSDTCDLL